MQAETSKGDEKQKGEGLNHSMISSDVRRKSTPTALFLSTVTTQKLIHDVYAVGILSKKPNACT